MNQSHGMERVEPLVQRPALLIPDFCSARVLAPLLLTVILVAVVLSLANSAGRVALLPRFLLLALYLEWIGLCGAAVLCWARRHLHGLHRGVLFAACWAMLQVVTLAVSIVAFLTAERVGLRSLLPPGNLFEFAFRNLTISAIVSLLLLRYFWVRTAWRVQVQAHADSRYQALAARIEPHFLLNTLNALTALIPSRPREAESMVEDLADLFRAGFDAKPKLVFLRDEVELVRTYLRIEQARLGERLTVEWQMPEALLDEQVPMLSLQPLVENAVLHGVGAITDGGTVRIRVAREGAQTVLEVENPQPPEQRAGHRGAGLAIRNIAERLWLLYGERASLEIGRENAVFRARLILPHIETVRESDHR